ncbi:FtsK/SpoIIIE domain-containing protein [Thermobispora bispora]|uniref:Cell division FtsK/SpoIIIE n=1 Tax=Thermobispora bispora (strain ATCC 19993 / DSM 43833 / CBS 139.67 / JCM 10125 / KCTC 9307 / NBRC 14880 / R51) TaxID=469371 RepID=D6Y5S2_THEBD|nr:FtsK/SpoIIIE domain-containing protein [Thermobispora bispora]ADG87418.1 cell division FtsK/SpoIIIE [Thermobispora bispora DSM 43833]
MRVMLTVVHGDREREVLVEGDETSTVAELAAALGRSRAGNVVRLARARAPYRLDGGPADHAPEASGLWLEGRRLDPGAAVFGLLRDGDRIATDPRAADATVTEEPDGLAELRVIGGPGAGAVHRLGLGSYSLGADPACAITVPDPLLPAAAAVVRLTPAAVTVEPAPGGEPVALLDGEPVTAAVPWPEGAVLTCGASAFAVGPVEPPDAHLDPLPGGGLAYHRPPRLARPAGERRIVVPAEPGRPEGARLQLLATFLPAVLGVVTALVFRQWYFLLFAAASPLIAIGQWASDRRYGRKRYRQALREYRERMAAFEERVAAAVRADEAERRAAAPDPAEVLLTAVGPRRRLWERRMHDPDALRLRVGLADLPAAIEFRPEAGPAQDAALPEPPLSRDVPVTLDLRRIGVAGVVGPRAAALGCARWLAGQAAALHSPYDLAIVVLSAHGDGAEEWSWVRWLPHCAPAARGGRFPADCVALIGADPEAAARRAADLAALVAERLGESEAGPYEGIRRGPRPAGHAAGGPGNERHEPFTGHGERPFEVLVVLDGAQVLRGLPGMPQVLRRGPMAGVYTIAIEDDERLLPEECTAVLSCAADGTVRFDGGGPEATAGIRADRVSPAWADRLARALAPLRDVSREDPAAALPGSVRLLDLIGPADPARIAAGWGRTTRAVIGVGPDGPFEIDLAEDGPHALIAGTTGSGKSELLQTLICSLAVANRPDELTFVLIDYKGGAAFKECVRLPHTVGMVTDLDGHLTQRALRSLAAEIRRRERLLLAAGAKDIGEYHRLRASAGARAAGCPDRPVRSPEDGTAREAGPHPAGGGPAGPAGGTPLPPLPRLVLIIDEFATLVAELPDFVAGLVDIARRGRSLGVHLILATQRPAGAVTPDIQANTSLRIALRVTDARESADVIDAPDAARIAPATPGRCYVKAGSAPPVAVQAARVGGRAPRGTEHPSGEVRVIDLPWRALGHPPSAGAAAAEEAAETDLSLLVGAVRAAARGIPPQPSPWPPPLPDRVVLSLPGLPEPGPADPQVEWIPAARPYRRGIEEVPPLPYGLADLPWEQRRTPLLLDLPRSGHLLIAGTARSGRSTALRTIAGAIAAWASPEDVHVHAIDCGSGALLPLACLPHCGAVVTREEADRVERLLNRLRGEVARRQRLLAEAGYASLAEARAAARARAAGTGASGSPGAGTSGAAATGSCGAGAGPYGEDGTGAGEEAGRLPWLVLLLDRWEGYVAAFDGHDYGRLLDEMLQLLREGPAVGLRAVVTADRSGLVGQISTVFDERLILRLADPSDYGLAGLPSRDLPGSMPPGRALSIGEHGLVESRIALLAPDPSGQAQVAALQELARGAAARFGGDPARPGAWAWPSEPPLRVDALPARITAEQAMRLDPSFTPPSPLWALLGAGGDALAPMGIDLQAQGPAAVIAGPPRSGRSSCLLTAARSLLAQGTPVLVVTPRRSPLRGLAGEPGVLAVLDGSAQPVTADGHGCSGPVDALAVVAGREPYAVLVDDAELISPDSPLGLALEEILRTGRDGGHGMLIAGSTADLSAGYRGFAAEARKNRTGLLLGVQGPADGDLFAIRLPRTGAGGPPGRGWLVSAGIAVPIQAAIPG